mgnify:CR=1 FL=1
MQAFNHGYCLAMSQGLAQLQQKIFDASVEESLKRMDAVVEERAKRIGAANPRQVMELQQKQSEFKQKLFQSRTPDQRAKYTYYLETLEWVLNANGVHQNQPAG